jgi:hypothetical protein
MSWLKNILAWAAPKAASVIANWQLAAVASGILLVTGFAGGWHLKAVFVAADKTAEIEAAQKAKDDLQTKYDTQSAAWETERAGLESKNKTLNRRLANEIKSKSIYSSCVVPSDGVRALSAAVSGSAAAGESGE